MNKTIKFTFVLIAFVFSFSTNYCQMKQNGNLRNLSLEIKNTPDKTYLYLWDENNKLVDSTLIINGKGQCKFYADRPHPFSIRTDFLKPDPRGKDFWMEDSDVKITGDYNDFNGFQVLGSESNRIAEIYQKIGQNFNTDVSKLEECLRNAARGDDRFDYKRQILSRHGEYRTELISAMKKEKNSFVTLFYLSWECLNNDLSKMEILDIYNSLIPELRDSRLGMNIKHFTELPSVPKIGDKYVNFTQFTPQGDTVRLSDYEGKITLVNYWDGYCSGSKIENPILAEVYKKYHPLGLEIIGVSNETNKADWIEEIKQANLPWILVSDLNGELNEVKLLYNFRMTPYNVLISKDGIITHRNLRSENLKKVLSEIFKF